MILVAPQAVGGRSTTSGASSSARASAACSLDRVAGPSFERVLEAFVELRSWIVSKRQQRVQYLGEQPGRQSPSVRIRRAVHPGARQCTTSIMTRRPARRCWSCLGSPVYRRSADKHHRRRRTGRPTRTKVSITPESILTASVHGSASSERPRRMPSGQRFGGAAAQLTAAKPEAEGSLDPALEGKGCLLAPTEAKERSRRPSRRSRSPPAAVRARRSRGCLGRGLDRRKRRPCQSR